MNQTYDITIIGLGPAGSILAKQLNPGFKVLALDKKGSGGGGFQKPCGGLLAPDAQKALSRFDMTLPKDILVDPQIFNVKTIDLQTSLIRHYQRHYINLDRHKFDRWLMSLIPSHIEVKEKAQCTHVTRQSPGFEIQYKDQTGLHTIRSQYVVGADGANSLVRKVLYPEIFIHSYLAIQQWYEDSHISPFYSCIFDSSVTNSYCWGITKNEFFIYGGAFKQNGAKKDFETIRQKLIQAGFHLKHPIKTEACKVLRPQGLGNFCQGTDGAFLIGEAAGFISPSSLEGLSFAMDSAFLLSESLNTYDTSLNCMNLNSIKLNRTNLNRTNLNRINLNHTNTRTSLNRLYLQKTKKIRTKIYLKQLKAPFMYQPMLRKLVMKSGLTAIKMAPKSANKQVNSPKS